MLLLPPLPYILSTHQPQSPFKNRSRLTSFLYSKPCSDSQLTLRTSQSPYNGLQGSPRAGPVISLTFYCSLPSHWTSAHWVAIHIQCLCSSCFPCPEFSSLRYPLALYIFAEMLSIQWNPSILISLFITTDLPSTSTPHSSCPAFEHTIIYNLCVYCVDHWLSIPCPLWMSGWHLKLSLSTLNSCSPPSTATKPALSVAFPGGRYLCYWFIHVPQMFRTNLGT